MSIPAPRRYITECASPTSPRKSCYTPTSPVLRGVTKCQRAENPTPKGEVGLRLID
jgi:hypothetical protein